MLIAPRFLVGVAILAAGYSFPAFADSALYAASGYNVFVQGNFSLSNSDIQGRVAAGGDLVVGGSISLATALPSGDTGWDVVGGTDFQALGGGSSNGNLYDGTAGGIASNFTVNGKVTDGPAPDPIDFSTAFNQLTALSDALKAHGTTGGDQCTNNGYQTISCNASAPGLNVINVQYGTGNTNGGVAADSYDFANNVGIDFTIAPGSTLVINILGTSAQGLNFSGAGWNVTGDSSKLLVNFPDAKTLTLGRAGFSTSLLAPNASVTLGGGNFDGNFIAKSMTNGITEFHDNDLFTGDLSSVQPAPEPSAWLLVGGGLLLFARRKRR